jgi:hypothetical protein
VPLETGNETGDAIVQSDFALVDEDHHARRCRNHLCQRREVEDRVRGHLLGAGKNSTSADGLVVDGAIADADEHHRSRQLLGGDGILDQRLDRIEPRRLDRRRPDVDAYRLRRCARSKCQDNE